MFQYPHVVMAWTAHILQKKTFWCVFFFFCANMQYYDDSLPTVKEQKKFEEMLFKKTRDAAGWLSHEYHYPMNIIAVCLWWM